jgi:hypothetical protein
MNSYLFNGSGDSLVLQAFSGLGDVTIAGKFNWSGGINSTNLFRAVCGFLNSSGADTEFNFSCDHYYQSSHGVDADVNINGTGMTTWNSGPAVSTGQPHTFALVRSGTTGSVYFDGTLIGTGTVAAGTFATDPLGIGAIWDKHTSAINPTSLFNGTIWQLGVWGSAWSAQDIANHAAGNDPTSIEWANNLAYLPLQANTADVRGGSVTVNGSPALQGTAPAISVSPSSIPAGSAATLTFTGTGTNWASGIAKMIPSAGSVGSETVASGTQRSTSYTPASAGTVTFIDPTTGATTTLTVTSSGASATVTPNTLVAGTTATLSFIGTGTNFTSGMTATPAHGTINGPVTVSDATHAQAGYTAPNSALADTITLSDHGETVSLTITASGGVTVSPTSVEATSTQVTLTFTGSGTNWTNATTFVPSAGSVVGSVVVYSGTSARLVFNAPAAPQTVNWTIGGTGTAPLTIAPRSATTYYVSPLGLDTNPGTSPQAPWQTIAKLNSWYFVPGDTILFQGGQSFAGTLTVGQSGSAAAAISFGSYGTGSATISCGNQVGLSLVNVGYLAFSDLNIVGVGVISGGAMADGSNYKLYGVYAESTQTTGTTLGTLSFDNVNVSGCYGGYWIDAGYVANVNAIGWSAISCTNFTVHDCLECGWHSFGYNFPAASTFQIGLLYLANFEIYNIYGWPDPSANGGWALAPASINAGLIERGVLHDCGINNNNPNGGPGGVILGSCRNVTVRFCEAYNIRTQVIDGASFDFDANCQDCVIEYCYSHDNDSWAFGAGTLDGYGATQNNTFRYNISENDCRKIGSEGALAIWAGVSNIVWHNNTVYFANGAAGSAAVRIKAAATGCQFVNNVLITDGFPCVINEGNYAATFVGNTYSRSDGGTLVTWNSANYATLAAFRAAISGQESYGGQPVGSAAAPTLRNPGAGGTVRSTSGPNATMGAYDPLATIPGGVTLLGLGIDGGGIDFHGRATAGGVSAVAGAVDFDGKNIGPGGGGPIVRPFGPAFLGD